MKLSPPHEPTTLAGIEVSAAVVDIVRKHDLTFAELISILVREIAAWTKFQIRDERAEPEEILNELRARYLRDQLWQFVSLDEFIAAERSRRAQESEEEPDVPIVP